MCTTTGWADLDEPGFEEWLRQRFVGVTYKTCSHCGLRTDARDMGVLFPTWCSLCETTDLERRVIMPLIRRLGLVRARRVLQSLTK
jgi:hypothetical protein